MLAVQLRNVYVELKLSASFLDVYLKLYVYRVKPVDRKRRGFVGGLYLRNPFKTVCRTTGCRRHFLRVDRTKSHKISGKRSLGVILYGVNTEGEKWRQECLNILAHLKHVPRKFKYQQCVREYGCVKKI